VRLDFLGTDGDDDSSNVQFQERKYLSLSIGIT
jgi:hypothetical protein